MYISSKLDDTIYFFLRREFCSTQYVGHCLPFEQNKVLVPNLGVQRSLQRLANLNSNCDFDQFPFLTKGKNLNRLCFAEARNTSPNYPAQTLALPSLSLIHQLFHHSANHVFHSYWRFSHPWQPSYLGEIC